MPEMPWQSGKFHVENRVCGRGCVNELMARGGGALQNPRKPIAPV
jgi:hypothetical protein